MSATGAAAAADALHGSASFASLPSEGSLVSPEGASHCAPGASPSSPSLSVSPLRGAPRASGAAAGLAAAAALPGGGGGGGESSSSPSKKGPWKPPNRRPPIAPVLTGSASSSALLSERAAKKAAAEAEAAEAAAAAAAGGGGSAASRAAAMEAARAAIANIKKHNAGAKLSEAPHLVRLNLEAARYRHNAEQHAVITFQHRVNERRARLEQGCGSKAERDRMLSNHSAEREEARADVLRSSIRSEMDMLEVLKKAGVRTFAGLADAWG